MEEAITNDLDIINLSIMVSKVNMIDFNPWELWVDISITKHVCSNKKRSFNFETQFIRGEFVYGQLSLVGSQGQGKCYSDEHDSRMSWLWRMCCILPTFIGT